MTSGLGVLGAAVLGQTGGGAAPAGPLMLLLVAALVIGVLGLAYKQARLRKRVKQADRRVALAERQLLGVRKRVYAQDAAAALAAVGREPAMRPEFTSQYGEDLFLWDLFEGKLRGFYIEVGAYDGHTFSVTYPFEAVGWTGVLVEALPERFKQCLDRRPASQVAHAALSRRGSAGTATFTVVEAAGSGGGAAEVEMLSFLRPSDSRRKLVKKQGERTRTLTVPLATMDDVLRAADPPPPAEIDFAVIDVEGAEVDLLDGFDLDRYKPRVLVVEDMEPDGGHVGVTPFLTRRHYTAVGRIGVSTVFVRSDEPALAARAAALLVREQ